MRSITPKFLTQGPVEEPLSDVATSAVNKKYAVYYNGGFLFKLDKTTGVKLSEIKDVNWQWNGYRDPTPVLFGEKSALVTASNYLTKFNLDNDTIDYSIAKFLKKDIIIKKRVYAWNI